MGGPFTVTASWADTLSWPLCGGNAVITGVEIVTGPQARKGEPPR
ncbi:MAG: hypothetical protein ACREE4_20590 [Stellaceae bacterium]